MRTPFYLRRTPVLFRFGVARATTAHRQRRNGQRRAQVLPPSMGMTAPVMKLDRSDARNEASSATSSGWPARFIAAPSTSCGKLSMAACPPESSVTMRPGQMAFARMPLVPYSTAAALVNAITPAFAALYTLVGMSDALSPPIDDQF